MSTGYSRFAVESIVHIVYILLGSRLLLLPQVHCVVDISHDDAYGICAAQSNPNTLTTSSTSLLFWLQVNWLSNHRKLCMAVAMQPMWIAYRIVPPASFGQAPAMRSAIVCHCPNARIWCNIRRPECAWRAIVRWAAVRPALSPTYAVRVENWKTVSDNRPAVKAWCPVSFTRDWAHFRLQHVSDLKVSSFKSLVCSYLT